MATQRSHKPYMQVLPIAIGIVAATKYFDGLTQLAEYYPDTIVVKGSSPLVITK
jgi:hypothetical protein